MALGATQPTSLLRSGDKEAPSLVFNCLLARSFTILALDAVLCQWDKVLKYRVSKNVTFRMLLHQSTTYQIIIFLIEHTWILKKNIIWPVAVKQHSESHLGLPVQLDPGSTVRYEMMKLCTGCVGHYEAVAVDNWWYWVSRGHLCLLHKVKIETGVTDALQTDKQTLKDRAT